jgi:hypothetical protein
VWGESVLSRFTEKLENIEKILTGKYKHKFHIT